VARVDLAVVLILGADEVEDMTECLCWRTIDGQELVPRRKDCPQSLLKEILQLNDIKKSVKNRIADRQKWHHTNILKCLEAIGWFTGERVVSIQ